VFAEGLVDPFAGTGPGGPKFKLLYVTDRAPATGDDEERFYRNARGHVLRAGEADIEFELSGIDWQTVKRESLSKTRDREYVLRVAATTDFGILDRTRTLFDKEKHTSADARFKKAIDARIAASRHKDVTIFVHGYLVVFEHPLLISAELWHFLGYEGAFIAYSWPSTPSTLAYLADLESATLTSRNLRLLVEFLAEKTDVRRIHVIGYSMGARVVAGMLQQIGTQNTHRDRADVRRELRLGHVMIIGSDMDRDIFAGQLLDGMLKAPETLTLYQSGSDSALGTSEWLFDRKRVGQFLGPTERSPELDRFLSTHKNFRIIDATAAEESGSGNGHWYFRKSPWVSSDILLTLLTNRSPAERGLVKEEGGALWRFPPDYVERLRSTFAKPRE